MLHITNKNQFLNYLFLVAGIGVLLNVVARSNFFRLDVTDGGLFKLSDSSKLVIAKLDHPLTARVFFSGELPGPYASSRRYLQDLLEEYEAYAEGNFHFEFVNPDKDSKAQEQARSANIPPIQLQALENDKMEIKTVYMGMVLNYESKRETIPVIQTAQGLEYNITATIKKLTSTGLKTIGLISEDNEEVSTQNLGKFLEQLYVVRRTTLLSPIDSDVEVLLVNGRADSLKPGELFHLDQFLMRGGRLFIGQSSVKDFIQQGFAMEVRSNIFSFLEHYGLKVGKELLVDKSCSQIQVQSQQGMFVFRNAIDYPPFPLIKKFNMAHPITANATVARLFFVNDVTESDHQDGVIVTPLMYTSDQTGALPGPFYQIQPSQNPMMNVFPYSSKVVAALTEANVGSYLAGDTSFSHRANFIAKSAEPVQIVLVTDNQFFNDRRAGGADENVDFILNTVDYLANERELITLRARNVKMQPLESLSDAKRNTLKWTNVLLPAALVVIVGGMSWRRQRSKRKTLEEMYD